MCSCQRARRVWGRLAESWTGEKGGWETDESSRSYLLGHITSRWPPPPHPSFKAEVITNFGFFIAEHRQSLVTIWKACVAAIQAGLWQQRNRTVHGHEHEHATTSTTTRRI